MALEVSMTGTGTIGDITPGWSVNEFVNSYTIGSTGAGTGSVSFGAKANDDSLLCINNDVVSTVNGFGTVHGVVQSVSQNGLNASITHGTTLDKLNLDMSVPPLLGGDIVSTIDYFEQAIIGNPRTSKTANSGVANQFFTLTGHGYSFLQGSDNRAVYQPSTVSEETYSYVGTGSEVVNFNYLDIRNQLSCQNFVRFNNTVYGNNVDGNMFYSEPIGGADLSSTFTVTTGSTATVTYTGGFVTNNSEILFTTTGSLPTISGILNGLTVSKTIVSGGSPYIEYWYNCNGHKVQVGDTAIITGFLWSSLNGTKTVTKIEGNRFYCGVTGPTDVLYFTGGPGTATINGPYRETAYASQVTSTTFKMAIQPDGTPIATFGTQSGTHTLYLTNSANRASRIYYKTFLNGANNTFNIIGEPDVLSFDWSLDANFVINHSAETISFTGEYALGGTLEPLTASTSIASLDVDSELAVFLQYYVTPGNNYKLTATVCNTSDYSTYVTLTQTLSNNSTPVINGWTITGNARDVYLEINTQANTSLTTEEYTLPSSFYVDESTRQPTAPIISYNGVFWEYVQMGCAAFGQEISVDGDIVTIRDVGTRTLDITNVVASPSVNPTSTLSGKQINIPYTNAAFIDGTVYDAADDGNNIISVRAGETTVTSVKHTVHPISVNQPTRSDVWPVNPGEYYVIDSSGIPLLAGEWEAYGASVSVEIDHEDPAAIQITVVGPYTDVTLAGGPYELAASDGATKYAALKIAGTGVYSGDNALGLLTGVDPDKYTRATVNTINNPFIATEEQAYDRGVWAAQKASGPTVTFSAQIPSSSVDGIGLTCGSLVNYRNSTYRIIASTISGIDVTINGERHVTVADVDALWSAKTVTEYDGFWGNYECQDQIIFPYMEA